MDYERLLADLIGQVLREGGQRAQAHCDSANALAGSLLEAYESDGEPPIEDRETIDAFASILAIVGANYKQGLFCTPKGLQLAVGIKRLLDLAHWVGYRKGQGEALERLMGD